MMPELAIACQSAVICRHFLPFAADFAPLFGSESAVLARLP